VKKFYVLENAITCVKIESIVSHCVHIWGKYIQFPYCYLSIIFQVTSAAPQNASVSGFILL